MCPGLAGLRYGLSVNRSLKQLEPTAPEDFRAAAQLQPLARSIGHMFRTDSAPVSDRFSSRG